MKDFLKKYGEDNAELQKSRAKVTQLEAKLRDMPQAEIVMRHYFAGGVYAREMFAPAGTVAVGKIILVDNIANISQGEVSIQTEDGVVRVKAPYQWIATAGTRRAAYFHTDTVWTVYVATESTDPVEAEAECTAESYDDPRVLALDAKKQIRGNA